MTVKISQQDKDIGERIRYYRKRANFTIQALAEEIGISYQQLQKYETGKNRIPASKLPNLALILDVSVLTLLSAHDDTFISTVKYIITTRNQSYKEQKV